ncbi:MAG: hypothetical protein ABF904_09515 [Ethanoligenens sp.]
MNLNALECRYFIEARKLLAEKAFYKTRSGSCTLTGAGFNMFHVKHCSEITDMPFFLNAGHGIITYMIKDMNGNKMNRQIRQRSMEAGMSNVERITGNKDSQNGQKPIRGKQCG